MMDVANSGTETRIRPAFHQTSVPVDKLLNSADAGFLIHRVGQLKNEFLDEGVSFSADLVDLINNAQVGYVSIFAFEELFGLRGRLHWLLHLKEPSDYRRMLDMVDHSQRWAELSNDDRLPTKGGGNWERMFVEGSMSETIICPQHGLSHHDDDNHELDTFQPPARYQSRLDFDQLLHSVNAQLTVHRRLQVRYALREEARKFWFDWAGYVSEAMVGRATAFLYEEMWGQQDRLHLLIHLGSQEAYHELMALQETNPELRRLMASPIAADSAGAGGWHRAVLDGTMTDTLWAPLRGSRS